MRKRNKQDSTFSRKQRKRRILVINGPNLNLLGRREQKIYGKVSIEKINTQLKKESVRKGVDIEFYQSNYEGKIVDKIQGTDADFIIINPAAFTHTSVAIRDALTARKIPFIEVHISNIYSREPFRKESFFSDKAVGVISGFREFSYMYALDFATKILI